MKGKHERRPPAAVKTEADLTAVDRAEMQMLRVGDGPFNKIVTDNAAFLLSPGWTLRKMDDKHKIRWEAKASEHSNKQAVRFTANVPHCNAASLEHALIDDRMLGDDPEVSKIYVYDQLITENHTEKRLTANVSVQRSNFRSPVFLVSPRQFVTYVTLSCLLDPAQQTALGLCPQAFADAAATEPRTDTLMAFMQCAITYTGSEVPVVKGHVLGHVYYYCVLAVEEPDGSVTLTYGIDMDPAGSLPAAVVDGALEEQMTKMRRLVEMLKQRGPAEHLCDVYENTRSFAFRNDV